MRFLPAETLQRECRGAEQKERYRRNGKKKDFGPNGELASLSHYLKIDSSLMSRVKPLQLAAVFCLIQGF